MKRLHPIIATAVSAFIFPLLAFAGPVNVNTADAETLSQELTGIGMSKAQAIVEFREQHGPFQSADELTDVKGIGQRIVDQNRDNIVVEPPRKDRQ